MLDDDEHAEYWSGKKAAFEGGTLKADASDEWKAGFEHGEDNLKEVSGWPTGPNVTYDVGDPELKVVQSHASDALYTFTTGRPPWDQDKTLMAALEAACWRYARLIGIVGAEDVEERAQLVADQAAYGGLVRTFKGLACWDNKEATTFVVERAGVSRQVAAAWLNLDWVGGGEMVDACCSAPVRDVSRETGQ